AFSGKTFRRLPKDLQDAILKAGHEAGAFGREIESTEDASILAQMEKEGKLRTHEFRDRDELLRLAEPVKMEYARSIHAENVLKRINLVK
ncbi:MAG TPA: C4-dicarboxylate ABC transporter substrate-binding protein, partial [Verrucomicrobia bacterium]|nr:C4-dicarboxylate ABC transporter substrate-binding protein [Verrucomicrobiota bacterium]